MHTRFFGVCAAWLRCWRYRMYLQRASFESEATLLRLVHGFGSTRPELSATWVRELVWRRGCDLPCGQKRKLAQQLLQLPVEALLRESWPWYSAVMAGRRKRQWVASGDRPDILAIDGNAKLYRRTCGQPFAEVVPCDIDGKHLLRGCSERPCGRDPLCKKHAAARDASLAPQYAELSRHRLRKALHRPDDVQHLEVQYEGYAGWQPASTVSEAHLEQYFARKAHAKIMGRRLLSQQHRKKRWVACMPRRRRTFLASWSSAGPKTKSECQTTKESARDVAGAARSAGFLLAITSSGIVAGLEEIIGAESLSQRYKFLVGLARLYEQFNIAVHDDACHLQAFAQSQVSASFTSTSRRLGGKDFTYIIDEFHAPGHVGKWCRRHLLPSLAENKRKLDQFPTSIAEVVNASFSPLRGTVHHQGPFLCKFAMTEMADVHNLKILLVLRERNKRTAWRVARQSAQA
ncbi:unnamed protein product, partial [Effrenium voratum]